MRVFMFNRRPCCDPQVSGAPLPSTEGKLGLCNFTLPPRESVTALMTTPISNTPDHFTDVSHREGNAPSGQARSRGSLNSEPEACSC